MMGCRVPGSTLHGTLDFWNWQPMWPWISGKKFRAAEWLHGGSPKCLVYKGKSYWNGWFRGTPILGNLHISGLLITYMSYIIFRISQIYITNPIRTRSRTCSPPPGQLTVGTTRDTANWMLDWWFPPIQIVNLGIVFYCLIFLKYVWNIEYYSSFDLSFGVFFSECIPDQGHPSTSSAGWLLLWQASQRFLGNWLDQCRLQPVFRWVNGEDRIGTARVSMAMGNPP